MQRLELQIAGLVQGIGFRPLVYQLAQQLNLTGWVLNNGAGVLLQIQGIRTGEFQSYLMQHLSALAAIENICEKNIAIIPDEINFEIKPSIAAAMQTEFIPDLSICHHCVAELFDANSRFYLYPFINCTQCGARYTITKALPYDRAQTSMQNFKLCQECLDDYHNPHSRRYHAEPIACEQCGPEYSVDLNTAANLIREEKIIAIKALGGYQLIANALSEKAVSELREKKQRPYKPFAVMLFNLASIKYYYHVNDIEEQLLLSPARPIVLLKIKKEFNALIAPSLSEHGVMLPYTGMHHVLFYEYLNKPQHTQNLFAEVLLVTSGNLSGQALIKKETDADQFLSKITPHLISHNREILIAADDSIVKNIGNEAAIIRRARGFVPKKIAINNLKPGILALGCHLKNTVCLTKPNSAYVSQYLGTLQNKSNIDFMFESIQHLKTLLNINIEYIAHDQHPDIYTTQLAEAFDLPTIAVQHHHAHAASVMAEYNLDEPALAWVLDGFGYFSETAAWGGELLLLDKSTFQSIAQLKSYPLLGSDKAAKEPWRMALSILQDLNLLQAAPHIVSKDPNGLLLKTNSNLKTSSCGRYFDAASSLLNICQQNTYEAEAALRLEALVTKPEVLNNGWELTQNILDFSHLWKFLLTVDAVTGANYFHGTLAAALFDIAYAQCQAFNIRKFILTGGCLQNKILAEYLFEKFRHHGIDVFYPRQLPCNDGGLSLGQAWVASQILKN